MSSFRKMTFITIITHMEPNILHQPLKMSSVFLLPPMPKAKGDSKTRMAVTTYRSATSKHSFTNCHMMTNPTMIISSQEAPRSKLFSSGMVIVTLEGTCRREITCAEIPRPISQICWLARSRKPNTNVLVNRSLGSSPSKPSPVAMLFVAWKTKFPNKSAQPTAMTILNISSVTGAT